MHLKRLQRLEFFEKKHPSILEIMKGIEETQKDKGLFYISDFEVSSRGASRNFKVNTIKPITSIFNQNIIAQEGLFVLNPHPETPIEEILRTDNYPKNPNYLNRPFTCFNIKKDLADYVRRRVKNKKDSDGDAIDIDKNYIYPKLNEVAPTIHENLLNGCIL